MHSRATCEVHICATGSYRPFCSLSSWSFWSLHMRSFGLPSDDPGKAALMIMVSKMLAVRRSLRGTEWDGAYLDHFVELMSRLDARRHGFGAADLGSIQAAWAETGKAGRARLVGPVASWRRCRMDASGMWTETPAPHTGVRTLTSKLRCSTRKNRARRTSGRQMHWTRIWLVD